MRLWTRYDQNILHLEYDVIILFLKVVFYVLYYVYLKINKNSPFNWQKIINQGNIDKPISLEMHNDNEAAQW